MQRGGGHLLALFYADDGMVGASDPEWLQGAFSALVAIFDRVGLQTNVDKTVSMACHPCRAGSGNRTVKYRPCRGSVSIASIELGVSYEP